MSNQPSRYVPCANCCSKCCHGVDLPDTLVGTFIDSGVVPCLNGYTFTLVNRTLPRGYLTQVVSPTLFFPVHSGWGEYTNVRRYWQYNHYGKYDEFQSYRRFIQGNPYPTETYYWEDPSLDPASLPYWAGIGPDAAPYPPNNQAHWQIGSCIGRALFRPQLIGEYTPIPEETAYSRTSMSMGISCNSQYAFSNPGFQGATYRQIAVECSIQSPAYVWKGLGGYATMTIASHNLSLNAVQEFSCDPFYLEFTLNVPEYWPFQNYVIGETRSTIGATTAGTITVIITE